MLVGGRMYFVKNAQDLHRGPLASTTEYQLQY